MIKLNKLVQKIKSYITDPDTGSQAKITGSSLNVNITNTSLDTRYLDQTTDSVEVGDGSNSISIDGSGNLKVALPQVSTNGEALITETHIENAIHEENHYYMEGFTTLNSGDTLYVKLVTPDTAIRAHFRWTIVSSGILETELYEGASGGMTGGSSITPLNNERNSSNASTITITKGVTAPTSTGTTISSIKVGGTGFKTVTGGDANREDELILKQNTIYCRKFESSSDDNIISFRANWIEE